MLEDSVEGAKNRAHQLLAGADAALARGEIDEEQWYRQIAAVITPAYLAGDNPRAQSGFSGDEARWEQARRLIVDAIDRDGTFLDIGCASGLLMESVRKWASENGKEVEPYGLDVAPELASFARKRLPRWEDRIYVGNVIDWMPPLRFDFVRTGLEYVPSIKRRDLVEHLLSDVVKPGGRLIVGTFNEEKEDLTLEKTIVSWGFVVSGHAERRHRDPRIVYRVFWLDAPKEGARPTREKAPGA